VVLIRSITIAFEPKMRASVSSMPSVFAPPRKHPPKRLRNPASPAQYGPRPSNGLAGRWSLPGKRVPRSPAITGAAPTPANSPPFPPFAPFPSVLGLGRSKVKHMRQPDRITLQRVSKLLSAARPLLVEEITTAWLARTLVRVDGGPILDAPRLGPALRMLGFQCTRRRRGTHRVSVWLRPGAAPPPLGRPPISSRGKQRHGY
jgi:hypothetical protein